METRNLRSRTLTRRTPGTPEVFMSNMETRDLRSSKITRRTPSSPEVDSIAASTDESSIDSKGEPKSKPQTKAKKPEIKSVAPSVVKSSNDSKGQTSNKPRTKAKKSEIECIATLDRGKRKNQGGAKKPEEESITTVVNKSSDNSKGETKNNFRTKENKSEIEIECIETSDGGKTEDQTAAKNSEDGLKDNIVDQPPTLFGYEPQKVVDTLVSIEEYLFPKSSPFTEAPEFYVFFGFLSAILVYFIIASVFDTTSLDPQYLMYESMDYRYEISTRTGAKFYVTSPELFNQRYPPGSLDRSELEKVIDRIYKWKLMSKCNLEVKRFQRDAGDCDKFKYSSHN